MKNVRNVLVKGPVIGMVGNEKILENLIKYLRYCRFKKVRTYYQYRLRKQEREELKRLKDGEYQMEFHESWIKMFLIANELGWLGNNDINKIREDFLEWIKKENLEE